MDTRHVSDRTLWNDFVVQSPVGHICQTYEWPDHIGAAARSNSLRLGVFDHERLTAAVLLVYNQADGPRAPFYYAPRGPLYLDDMGDMGDMGAESPALRELLAFARHEASARDAFMIRFEPNIADTIPGWAQRWRTLGLRATRHAIYPRNSWVTDISPREDELLAAMSKSWRYGVRRGLREGVTVRRGQTERDFDAFYALLQKTGIRDRFHVHPPQLYRDMLTDYSPERAAAHGTAEMLLFLAEHDDAPIAAATIAVHGPRAWYMHGALTDDAAQRNSEANRVLLWHGIRWAKRRGATSFDWRTIPDVLRPDEELYGVYAFKRGFGGAVHRVMPSHDLVLRPAIYWPYLASVTARHALHVQLRHRFERRRRRTQPTPPIPQRPPRPQPTHGSRPALEPG